MTKLTIALSRLGAAGRRAGARLRSALPSQFTVSMLLGIGSFGWGAWEWWGPGPAKVVVGLIFILNAIGLATATKRKAK